jgi:hypothetical protein
MCAVLAAPATAQEADESNYAIDLLVKAPSSEEDEVAVELCEAEADAARIAGEIVVCRTLDKITRELWNQKAWERDYARRTQGPKTPKVDGSGLILPTEGSLFMVTFTAKFGEASEQPVTVDFEALPDAPPGSDADRIARGLPPLGDD